MVLYYYCHPDWLKELIPEIPLLDSHWVGEPDTEMPDWPWERLAMSGLAFIDHCACGTSEAALIWGQEDLLLTDYLEKAAAEDVLPHQLRWAYTYFVNNDPLRAREIFESDTDETMFWRTAVTHLIFNDKKTSRQMLEVSSAEETDVSASKQKAMNWARLFSDMERSKDILLSAEQQITGHWDYIDLARAWMAIFQDDQRAGALLLQAERQSRWFREYLQLAKDWKNLLNADDKAVQLMRKAESEIEGHGLPSLLRSLARRWQRFFNDAEEAERLLKRAEAIEARS